MRKSILCLWACGVFALSAAAQPPRAIQPAPDRRADEGEGPFERLVIRGVTMIDGTGAPPLGPVDLVIENNRIREFRSASPTAKKKF